MAQDLSEGLGNEYTGCQKKSGTAWFSGPCELKVSIYFTSLVKASFTEDNDTKIIEFGWVILNLFPFLEIQSSSNFAWFLQPKSVELYRERPFRWCFGEAHWSERCHIRPFSAYTFLLLTRINGLPQNTLWKAIPDTMLRSSVAKINQNLKMTVFHEMGIESILLNQIQWFWYHSLLRKMLYFNDVKEYDTFRSQGTEYPQFRFFGDTQYSALPKGTTATASRFEPRTSRLCLHILSHDSSLKISESNWIIVTELKWIISRKIHNGWHSHRF